jgi:hypothetical protein
MDVEATIVTDVLGRRWIRITNYEKPSNRFSYLPYNSFHSRACRLGWLKGETIRLMINSSTLHIWKRQVELFTYRVLARGHKLSEVRKAIAQVRFPQRTEILRRLREEPKCVALEKKEAKEEFQKQFKGCVFSVRNVPGFEKFVKEITPDLLQLQMTCWDGGIFPQRAFISRTSPQSLSARVKGLANRIKARKAKAANPE